MVAIKVIAYMVFAFVGVAVMSLFASAAFVAFGAFLIYSFTENSIPMLLGLLAWGAWWVIFGHHQ